VGPLLTDKDDALTGRAFPVNTDTIGLMSVGTKATNMPKARAGAVNKPRAVEPCANAAQANMTNYNASKLARPRTDLPEVAREGAKKEDVTKGERDPESNKPCSSPRPRFVEPPDKRPMPAMASNKNVLRVQPIRTRKPDEIEKGEYDKFYGSTASNMNGPMTQTHFIAEGEVTFKSFLFDPDSQPSEQFNKQGQAAEHIKLNIRRVFVTDDFKDMINSYHSFVNGVIESDDPPLNVSRSKRDQGRQLEALTEEEDSGDRQDDGVHDDHHQNFTLPIYETTNPVNTACLILKAVEEHSLVEGYKGDMSMLENMANKSATDIAVLMYNTATLKSGYSLEDEEEEVTGEEPHEERDDQDRRRGR
jgi:hypothetical protein